MKKKNVILISCCLLLFLTSCVEEKEIINNKTMVNVMPSQNEEGVDMDNSTNRMVPEAKPKNIFVKNTDVIKHIYVPNGLESGLLTPKGDHATTSLKYQYIYFTYKAILFHYVYEDLGLNEYEIELRNLSYEPANNDSWAFFEIENYIHVERLSQEQIDAFQAYIEENKFSPNALPKEFYQTVSETVPEKLKDIVRETYANVISVYPLDYEIPEDNPMYPYIQKGEDVIGYFESWEPNAGIYDLALSIRPALRSREIFISKLGDIDPSSYLDNDLYPRIEESLSEKMKIPVSVI